MISIHREREKMMRASDTPKNLHHALTETSPHEERRTEQNMRFLEEDHPTIGIPIPVSQGNQGPLLCADAMGAWAVERMRGSVFLIPLWPFRQRIVLPQEDFEARLRMMKDLPLGYRARVLLAQLWERPDGVDLLTLHRLTGIPCGYGRRLLVSLQRRGYVVSSHTMHEPSRYQLNPSWNYERLFLLESMLPNPLQSVTR